VPALWVLPHVCLPQISPGLLAAQLLRRCRQSSVSLQPTLPWQRTGGMLRRTGARHQLPRLQKHFVLDMSSSMSADTTVNL